LGTSKHKEHVEIMEPFVKPITRWRKNAKTTTTAPIVEKQRNIFFAIGVVVVVVLSLFGQFKLEKFYLWLSLHAYKEDGSKLASSFCFCFDSQRVQFGTALCSELIIEFLSRNLSWSMYFAKILKQFWHDILRIWIKMCFEFCENTKVEIFRISQGLTI